MGTLAQICRHLQGMCCGAEANHGFSAVEAVDLSFCQLVYCSTCEFYVESAISHIMCLLEVLSFPFLCCGLVVAFLVHRSGSTSFRLERENMLQSGDFFPELLPR